MSEAPKIDHCLFSLIQGILIIRAAAATIPHGVIQLDIHQVFLVKETFDLMPVNVNLQIESHS